MEDIKEFLDTSTVHGLSWISSTKRLTRFFWIFIVVGGFTGAGYLIYESFDNWERSPISTTIETLPINEITFPNVTVCPPRNSFLNLNYDIIQSEKIKLDNETRRLLLNSAVDIIQDEFYHEMITNLSKVEDPKRYYNWYLGYTKMNFPYYKIDRYAGNELFYSVFTTATSGNISTKNYGSKFDAENVDRNMEIKISLLLNNNKFTVFDIEKITMKEIGGIDQFKYGETTGKNIDADIKYIWENVTGAYKVELERKLSKEDIDNVNLNLMPGFKLSWYSVPRGKPEAKYISSHQSKKNDEFRR